MLAGTNIAVDRAVFRRNGWGLYVPSGRLTVDGSRFERNDIGLYLASGGYSRAIITNSRITGSSQYGIYGDYWYLGHSVLAFNNYAWYGANAFSYGDNVIQGNTQGDPAPTFKARG